MKLDTVDGSLRVLSFFSVFFFSVFTLIISTGLVVLLSVLFQCIVNFRQRIFLNFRYCILSLSFLIFSISSIIIHFLVDSYGMGKFPG